MTWTVVGIQARMGSSRLPGKVMADLGGAPMIWRVYQACEGPWDRVVFTSMDQADDTLATWLRSACVWVERGSLVNVLSRYTTFVHRYVPGKLVRVCGDAPFLKKEWIVKALAIPGPVFVPNALHAGSWRDWVQCEKETGGVDEHAGHDWFRDHGTILDLVPDGYLMVNTPADLEEARLRFGAP